MNSVSSEGFTDSDYAARQEEREIRISSIKRRLDVVPVGKFSDYELVLLVRLRGLFLNNANPKPLTESDLRALESKCS